MSASSRPTLYGDPDPQSLAAGYADLAAIRFALQRVSRVTRRLDQLRDVSYVVGALETARDTAEGGDPAMTNMVTRSADIVMTLRWSFTLSS